MSPTTTGTGVPFTFGAPPAPKPRPIFSSAPTPINVYLSFQGVKLASGYRQGFDVMCGDNPPSISGGYGNWTELKRPLQRSLTIYQGCSPVSMTVEVRFGVWNPGWDQSDQAGKHNEENIRALERMAGVTTDSGPPPVVYVWSHSAQGGDTDLIPALYRGFPWIINGGIQWGTSFRNPHGYRLRQDATFTLQNFLNLTKPPAPETKIRGGYFVTGPGRNTALQIAANQTSRSPIVDHQMLAKAILRDPKNNPVKGTSIRLGRKSISWPMRFGLHVWVPAHQSLF